MIFIEGIHRLSNIKLFCNAGTTFSNFNLQGDVLIINRENIFMQRKHALTSGEKE